MPQRFSSSAVLAATAATVVLVASAPAGASTGHAGRAGNTGHAAILARSRGIPAVSGVEGIMNEVANGDLMVVENGVQPGETVVVTGQLALAPGAKVDPKPYVPNSPTNQDGAPKSTM